MNILITGNMGYIGPSVVRQLRQAYPNSKIVGVDIGYFAHCLTNAKHLPETMVDVQYFADVRNFNPDWLSGIDAVVHLAAISNDPMGNTFEKLTLDVNHLSSVRIAEAAKKAGVKNYVFASSCSMYGYAEGSARDENSEVNPLTAYAKSKVYTERDIKTMASDKFNVTCLRFATACGMSERLRLDLVLNDFVACALSSGEISILSDGTPWRPLINVKDMARSIEWAVTRKASNGGEFLAVNVGTDGWNYQVKELADAVARAIPGTKTSVNKDAPPDKRSYKVDFGLFKKLAPNHQPQVDLAQAVNELKEGLAGMRFKDDNFRQSTFMRLKVLTQLREQGVLSEALEWKGK